MTSEETLDLPEDVSGNHNFRIKALEKGPLESVFPGSTSKVLDFLATFREWDYSMSDIAKHSGISFKTALGEIRNLEQQSVIKQTRTVGKATMYKLDLESKQGYYIDKLVFEIAKKRALEQTKEVKTREEGKSKKSLQKTKGTLEQVWHNLKLKKINEGR